MLNLESDNLLYDTVVQQKSNKYENHFSKMYRDVRMAVPKTTQTRYMNGSVQATQRTTQVTPSLHLLFLIERVSKLCCQSTGNSFGQITKMKKRCRKGVVLCVACTLPSMYLYRLCGSWHCHSNIPIHFWKMFFILVLHRSSPWTGASTQ